MIIRPQKRALFWKKILSTKRPHSIRLGQITDYAFGPRFCSVNSEAVGSVWF